MPVSSAQTAAQASVDKIISSQQGAETNRTVADLVQKEMRGYAGISRAKGPLEAAIADLSELNKKGVDQLSPSEEAIRADLEKAIVDIVSEIESLSEEEQRDVIYGLPNTPSAYDPAASDVSLGDAKKLKELVETGRGSEFVVSDPLAAGRDAEESEDSQTIVRTSTQCFLLYNMEYFSDHHKSLLSANADASGDFIKRTGYFKQGTTDPRIYLTQEESESSLLDNKTFMCPGHDKFSKIQTHEYAQLIPLLRIYKVYRNFEDTGKDVMIEMDFENKTSLDGITSPLVTRNPLNVDDPGAHSRGSGIGVKSFDWKFLGSDPYTATRDIEATLKLHLQHFSTLVENRSGPDKFGNSQFSEQYKYIDLLLQPDINAAPGTNFYNPGKYEIRIDVGYASQEGELKDAICCQKDSLYLVHVDHGFDFREDGSMDLTIGYRGRLETIMDDRKFNVLLPGGGFIEETVPGMSLTAPTTPFGFIKFYQDEIDSAKAAKNQQKVKENQRLLSAVYADLKQYTYSYTLQQLQSEGMIFEYEIKGEEFKNFRRWREPRYKGALPPKLNASSPTPPTRTSRAPTEELAIKSALAAAKKVPSTEDFDVSDITSKVAEATLEKQRQRLQAAVKADKINVRFVYLGDLMAIVMASVFNEIPTTSFSQSLTSGQLFGKGGVTKTTTLSTGPSLPKSPSYQHIIDHFHTILGNLEYEDELGNKKYVNLAHIPVSLEMYQDFMVKNVISKDLNYYSLMRFFDDLIKDIILGLFSDQCFDGLLSVDARTSTRLVESETGLNTGARLYTFPAPYKRYKALWPSRAGVEITGTKQYFFDPDESCKEAPFKEPKQYFIFNTLNTYPQDLAGTRVPGVRGDNIGDEARGILHFTYGEDRGILKTVQFSKTDQEYLPEARFASGDGNLLNQLSNVYDANFNMLGNNIFKPGMLIYFDPSSLGAGKPYNLKRDSKGDITDRSWSNLMGIGGYHLVTEVAHSIKPGKYDTSVRARYVSSGEDKS